ncbi:MAG: hypothetical protein GC166_07240 [Alphaproteobacteria bacterium]|nr:hypothetical protein [Alphaproteobacteria bacterium]
MSELCRHFGACGGCLTQDMPPGAYHAAKKQAVVDALQRNGFADPDVADIVSVPPFTRRRAVLKVARRKGETAIGFHARQSHDIVDMRECRLLTAPLFRLVQNLRGLFNAILNDGENAEAHVTETDTGFDIALRWQRKSSPTLIAQLAPFAAKFGIARITAGKDVLISLAEPALAMGRARVVLPPHVFLQPTREGEAMLQQHVRAMLKGARRIADLFSGCGTFGLPLAERAHVHAVELEAVMVNALAAAARGSQGLKPVTTERRDLFKQPLEALELKPFDAVLMDPPRAGALAQSRALAASRIGLVAYVSCDSGSFARDARILVDAGFRMGTIYPIDQFLWSGHIELAACFVRG